MREGRHAKLLALAEEQFGAPLYSVAEAGRLLGLSPRTVRMRLSGCNCNPDTHLVGFRLVCTDTTQQGVVYLSKASVDTHPYISLPPGSGLRAPGVAKASRHQAEIEGLLAAGWVRLQTLANELGRHRKTLQGWAGQVCTDKDAEIRVAGTYGEILVAPALADALRQKCRESEQPRQRPEAPAPAPAPQGRARKAPAARRSRAINKPVPPVATAIVTQRPVQGPPPEDPTVSPGYHLALMRGRDACSDPENPRPLGFLILLDGGDFRPALVGRDAVSGKIIDRNICCGGRWMRATPLGSGLWAAPTEGVALNWTLIPREHWPAWKRASTPGKAMK